MAESALKNLLPTTQPPPATHLRKSLREEAGIAESSGGYHNHGDAVMLSTASTNRDDAHCMAEGGGCMSRYGGEEMPIVFGRGDGKDDTSQNPSDNSLSPATSNQVMSGRSNSHNIGISIKSIGEYDLIKTIGSGSTGKVKLAVHRQSQEQLAVKIVPRRLVDTNKKRGTKETTECRERRILREAAILNLINHENIVKLRDFLITSEYFCLFFEYVDGMQLLDYIVKNGHLSEAEARDFFRQIVSAVDYCHHNSIVHRDLKIENILVTPEGKIKLLDFGLSNFFDPNEKLDTFCGSLYFAAPELLSGRIYMGPEVDVWSLGIILFVLTCGKVPFDDKSLPALHEKIKACRLMLPDRLSFELKDLLRRMICRVPHERASLDEVIMHTWSSIGYLGVPAYLPEERLPLDMIDANIVDFLVEEFESQYTQDQIESILETARHDWTAAFRHPVISLYYLAKEKLLTEGALRGPTRMVLEGSRERSKSLSEVFAAATLSSAQSGATFQGTDNAAEISARRHNSMSSGKDYQVPGGSHSYGGVQNLSAIGEGAVPVLPPLFPNKKPAPNYPSVPHEFGVEERSFLEMQRLASMSPQSQDNHLGIKTVYLKGFWNVTGTTPKAPVLIRQDLERFFTSHGIWYEDHKNYYRCEHQSSVLRSAGLSAMHSIESPHQAGSLRMEVHIVRVAIVGSHGLQFKRLMGSADQFKKLCTQIQDFLQLST